MNSQGKGGTILEKAYLRMSAALGMLKIASNDALSAITSTNEHIFQKYSVTLDIMSAQQWHSLATVLLDNQEFVREKFLLKLNKGLISLNLGLEFLAIYALGGLPDMNVTMKNKVKAFLHLNYVKRRDLVKARCTQNLKSIVPECVIPMAIHLLAHMPFYTQYDDVRQLQIVKGKLKFCHVPLIIGSFSRLSMVHHGATCFEK